MIICQAGTAREIIRKYHSHNRRSGPHYRHFQTTLAQPWNNARVWFVLQRMTFFLALTSFKQLLRDDVPVRGCFKHQPLGAGRDVISASREPLALLRQQLPASFVPLLFIHIQTPMHARSYSHLHSKYRVTQHFVKQCTRLAKVSPGERHQEPFNGLGPSPCTSSCISSADVYYWQKTKSPPSTEIYSMYQPTRWWLSVFIIIHEGIDRYILPIAIAPLISLS